MRIGFTGTRKGMNYIQSLKLQEMLRFDYDNVTEFHHGDCVGCDDNFDQLARYHLGETLIVIHPPKSVKYRAFCDRRDGNTRVEQEYGYLERNRHIVDSSDVLIAVPNSFEEQERSGTWMTVRYARKRHKPVVVIFSDGTVLR